MGIMFEGEKSKKEEFLPRPVLLIISLSSLYFLFTNSQSFVRKSLDSLLAFIYYLISWHSWEDNVFTRKNSFGRVLDFVRDVEKIIMKMNDRKGNVESCLTGGVLQIHDSRVAGQPLLCQSLSYKHLTEKKRRNQRREK